MTLQEVCRIVVRRILRKNIQLEYPSLTPGAAAKRRPPRPARGRPRRCDRRRRINFIPMQAGLMIVGQFPPMDSDDENSTDHHGLDDPHTASALSDDGGDGTDPDNDGSPLESAFLRPLFWRSRPGLLRSDSATEEDMAFGAEMDEDREVRMENGVAYKNVAESTNSESEEEEEIGDTAAVGSSVSDAVTTTSNTASSDAIIIHTSQPSASNGYSTSYSSGIGTCSSLGAESESGNSTDMGASTDDLVKNGTPGAAAAGHDGIFDDDPFCGMDLSAVISAAKARIGGEDQRAERMEDIAEVQEEPCVAAEAEEPEDYLSDEPEPAEVDVNPSVTVRSCLRDKISLLPVPAALKDYLHFYRK